MRINGVAAQIKSGRKYAGRKLIIIGNDVSVDGDKWTPIVWKGCAAPTWIKSGWAKIITRKEYNLGTRRDVLEELIKSIKKGKTP